MIFYEISVLLRRGFLDALLVTQKAFVKHFEVMAISLGGKNHYFVHSYLV